MKWVQTFDVMMNVCTDQSVHSTRKVTIHQQLWQNTLKEQLYVPVYLTICYLQLLGHIQSGNALYVLPTK